MKIKPSLAIAVSLAFAGAPAWATDLVIATVNNGHMIEMQKLTPHFEKAHPDIKLKWVTLEEGVLRQRVTTDIATKGGQFDVLTIGTYEVPIWAKQGWLVALDNLGADYDVDDLLPPIRAGCAPILNAATASVTRVASQRSAAKRSPASTKPAPWPRP